MRKTLLIILVALVGLAVGYGAGGFLTYNRVMETVSNIPASPIVLGSHYDKEAHAVVYMVSNPGSLPLQIVQHSLVFTPGEQSEVPAYVLTDVPSNITLPPFSTVAVALDLKENTAALEVGDVVAATINYTHPLSPDLYAVVHLHVAGADTTAAPAEAQEGTPEANAEVEQ